MLNVPNSKAGMYVQDIQCSSHVCLDINTHIIDPVTSYPSVFYRCTASTEFKILYVFVFYFYVLQPWCYLSDYMLVMLFSGFTIASVLRGSMSE